MTNIDFDALRTIQRKERNVASLTEVPQDFYKQLASYINSMYSEAQSAQDLGKLRLLENTVKIARDITQRRMQKIVARAMKTVKTGEGAHTNMTEEEVVIYNEVIEALNKYKSFSENVLAGKYEALLEPVPPSVELGDSRESESEVVSEEPQENMEMLINESGQNLVLARVIRPIPRFVATDGNEYGPYEPEEIIRLPEEVANILGEQGLLEIL